VSKSAATQFGRTEQLETPNKSYCELQNSERHVAGPEDADTQQSGFCWGRE